MMAHIKIVSKSWSQAEKVWQVSDLS